MPKIKKITGGSDYNLPLRVTFRERSGAKAGRYLIRCGCCKQRLEIYPAEDPQVFGDDPNAFVHTGSIEIGGVNGSVAQWRELLCPILGLKNPTKRA